MFKSHLTNIVKNNDMIECVRTVKTMSSLSLRQRPHKRGGRLNTCFKFSILFVYSLVCLQFNFTKFGE